MTDDHGPLRSFSLIGDLDAQGGDDDLAMVAITFDRPLLSHRDFRATLGELVEATADDHRLFGNVASVIDVLQRDLPT